MNKHALFCSLGTCLTLASTQANELKQQEEKPNVLFIIMDDMCDWASMLSGHNQVISPNLQRLADRGINFANAYTVTPLSNPSRAALLTGIPSYVSGVYNNSHEISNFPVIDNSLFMPQHFKNNGYKTIMSGKVFHTKPSATVLNNMWDDKTNMDGGYGPWIKNQSLPPDLQLKWRNYEAWTGPDTDFPDVKNSNKIIQYLGQSHEKPFFAAMGFYRPHTPYTAPKRYFDLYDISTIQLPDIDPNDLDDLPAYAISNFLTDQEWVKKLFATGNYAKEMVRAYLACVSFADDRIGKILDALEASPYADNTLIVVIGDNGHHHGDKNHWGKSTLWREANHVPMVVVPPMNNTTIQRGVTCTTPVSLLDLYPTLIEMCNLPEVTNQLAGVSLTPLIQNVSAKRNVPAVSNFLPGNFVVHQQQWNYIRYANGAQELYNLDSDENEFQNLAGNIAYQYLLDSLDQFVPKSWYTGPPEVIVSSISEDFSSSAWDTEIKRLNPTYTRPVIEGTFDNINNTDLYFGKYRMKGALKTNAGSPNCVDNNVIHGDLTSALAFRLKNDSSGYLELPTMENAGTLYLHLRSGVTNNTGYLTLQQFDGEEWENMAILTTRGNNAYAQTSMDEIISHPVNINEQVKLRIRGGNRFTQIFRFDVTPFDISAIPQQYEFKNISINGRDINVHQPTLISVYNSRGQLVLHKQVEHKINIPESAGKGIFLIKTVDGVQKILLNQ